MKEKKYISLKELLEDKKSLSKSALLYSENNLIKSVSYQDLIKNVYKEKEEFDSLKVNSVVFMLEKKPSLIYQIFGAILSGMRVGIIDPSEPLDKAEEMIKAFETECLVYDEDEYDEDEKAELNELVLEREYVKKDKEGSIVFFTSGTSGPSKGVELEFTSLLCSAWCGQMMLQTTIDDNVISLLPLSHVFGFVCTLLWPLAYSSTVSLGRGLRYVLKDPYLFKPTILPLIPNLTMLLITKSGLNKEARIILVGAGPLPKVFTKMIRDLGLTLALGYGLTETSSGVAISVNSEDPYFMKPCPGNEFKLEEDGTLSIKSDTLMKGYYNLQEETKKMIDSQGYFHTSDLAEINSKGEIKILGRKDDILVLDNGTKFNALKAESELSALLPSIDLGIYEEEGKICLAYFSRVESSDLIVNLKVSEYNAKQPLYAKIQNTKKLSSPLPRTKTGKLQRYLIK